jgi:pseudaminic acid biosynthesis-associated methylase
MVIKKENNNEQVNFWEGKFGDAYTIRNSNDPNKLFKEKLGVTRTQLNKEFFSDLDKNSRIFEVGCNRGNQIKILKKMGFSNLTGIEINKNAINLAREDKDLCIMEANAFDIPFKDNYFDLVFTSGVLIHIAPENLEKVIKEMVRVSNRYIFGFEYFSENCENIEYRGNKNKLWKNNFPQLFLKLNPSLKLIKSKKMPYLDGSGNIDIAYLLENNRN